MSLPYVLPYENDYLSQAPSFDEQQYITNKTVVDIRGRDAMTILGHIICAHGAPLSAEMCETMVGQACRMSALMHENFAERGWMVVTKPMPKSE